MKITYYPSKELGNGSYWTKVFKLVLLLLLLLLLVFVQIPYLEFALIHSHSSQDFIDSRVHFAGNESVSTANYFYVVF